MEVNRKLLRYKGKCCPQGFLQKWPQAHRDRFKADIRQLTRSGSTAGSSPGGSQLSASCRHANGTESLTSGRAEGLGCSCFIQEMISLKTAPPELGALDSLLISKAKSHPEISPVKYDTLKATQLLLEFHCDYQGL